MSIRLPLRGFALSFCALVVALACAPPAGAAEPLRRDFFSFNACGNVCNKGGLEVADAIYDSIIDGTQQRPHGVMLQEMCRNQYERLRVRIEAANSPWQMDGEFLPARSDVSTCGTTGEFGNAVFVTGTIEEVDRVRFYHQGSGGETRNMICAKVNWRRYVRVCSTHLINTDEQCSGGYTCRWLQANEVRTKTSGYIDNAVPVVVGGDFNARPSWDTLDHLYAGWIFGAPAAGRFKEVDQFYEEPQYACRCGEVTWESRSSTDRAKFDYIFVSGGDFDYPGGFATSSQYSDHHPLRGNAMLQIPG